MGNGSVQGASALDKVGLAAADLLEPSALVKVSKAAGSKGTSEDDVHDFLLKQCPWYSEVSDGKNPGDPETRCIPAGGKIKLTPRTAEASTVPEPIGKPGGPGLWHVKGMQLPPYVQHLAHHLIGKYGESRGIAMAKGIVAKWKAGINPGGRHKKGHVSHVHADVKAAAARAIAQWEEKRARAHAQSREHDREKVKATVALAGGSGPTKTKAEAHFRESDSRTRRCGTCSMFRGDHCTLVKGSIDADDVCDYWKQGAGGPVKLASSGTVTAPGAKPEYGLYQHPSQTVSPSPPTPPDVKLPTAAEIRKLKAQVPDCTDASLSASARNHLDAAAVKLAKDDPIAALHVLRIAQSDIYAAHKADLGKAMPAVMTANMFTRVPPAEQSSANAEMIRSKDRELTWRRLEQQVASAIDRIRRKHFHGMYPAGMQEARFAAGADCQDMSALDKVLLAAGSPAAPAEIDPAAELLLAAQLGMKTLAVMLAADDDDDDDDDSSGKDGGKGDTDNDAGHVSHATFKALKAKGVPDAKAAAMCAKADKKVKASALAESLQVILAGLFDEGGGLVMLATPASETAEGRRKAAKSGHALPDGSYPIEDKKHLHKAAVLAASGHGDVAAAKRLIRKRARELGVDVNTLPGFGGSSDKDEKVAASMVALAAAKPMGDGGVPMHHPPFTGTHSHSHHLTAAHNHPHQHFGDSNHDGGPQHRPGSKPGQGRFSEY